MREIAELRKIKVVMVGFDNTGRPTHQRVTDNSDIDLKIISDEKFKGCDIVGIYEIGKLLELHPAHSVDGV